MAGKIITGAANEWLDVYAASGFAVGTRLLIQNQNGYKYTSKESEAMPESSQDGRWIYPGAEAEVDSGSPGCWIISDDPITAYVQEKP